MTNKNNRVSKQDIWKEKPSVPVISQNSELAKSTNPPNQTTKNSSMQLSSLFLLSSLALFQEGCSSAISALKVREGFFSQGEVSLFSSVTPTNLDLLGAQQGKWSYRVISCIDSMRK
jgi:hypothetical protein